MAKKAPKRAHTKAKRKTAKRVTAQDKTYVAVQGWMFVVVFALMLGIGAIVGTYFNHVLNGGVPTVAGVQTELR